MNKIDSRFIEFDTSDPNAVTGDDISISTTNSDKLDTPGTTFSQQDGAPTSMAQDSTAVITHPSLSEKEGQVVFQVMELVEGSSQNTTDIIAYTDKDKWDFENVQGTVDQLQISPTVMGSVVRSQLIDTGNNRSLGTSSGGVVYREAQTFNISSETTISRISLFFDGQIGSPGTVDLRIETTAVGVPLGTLAHANATKTFTPSISSWTDIDFDTPVTLAAGGYAIVVECTSDPASNNYYSQALSEGTNPYAQGNASQKVDSGAWTMYVADDFMFKVWDTVAGGGHFETSGSTAVSVGKYNEKIEENDVAPNGGPGLYSTQSSIGQTFTLASEKVITKVEFIGRRANSVSGPIVARLRSVTGTVGSTAYGDTVLATSESMDISNISTTGPLAYNTSLLEFNFPTPYTATAGDYAIELYYTGSYGLDFFSGATHAHAGNSYINTTPDAGTDLIFYLYAYGNVDEPKIQAGCQFKLDSDSTIYSINETLGDGTDEDAILISPQPSLGTVDVDWIRGNDIPETGDNADKLSLSNGGAVADMSDYEIYMPLSSASGKTDLSDGSHGTAINSGSPTIVTGEVNDPFGNDVGVLKTDANGEHIYFPDNSAWDPSGDYTMEVWVYMYDDGAEGGAIKIMGQHYDANNTINFYLNQEPGVILAAGAGFYVGGTQRLLNQVDSANRIVSLNQWHHLAAIRSGNDVGVYVDGKLGRYGNLTSWPSLPGSPTLEMCEPHTGNGGYGYWSNLRFSNSNIYGASPDSGFVDTFDPPNGPHCYSTNQYYTATTNDSGQVDISEFADINEGIINDNESKIADSVIISQLTNTGNYISIGDQGGNEYKSSQSFTLASDTWIGGVSWWANVNINSPTGLITVRIENGNSTSSDNTLANVNATAEIINVVSSKMTAEFSTPFMLTAGKYWIVWSTVPQSSSNYYTINIAYNTNPMAGEKACQWNGSAWNSTYDASDLQFELIDAVIANVSYYSISTDARDSYKIFNQTGSTWRDIARDNSGTWQYNNNAAHNNTATWADSDINSAQAAISQAIESQEANRMIGSEYESITDEEWNDPNGWVESQSTLDLAVTQTSTSSNTPTVGDFAANYDLDGAYQTKRLVDDYEVERITDTTTKFTKVSAGTASSVYCTVIV